MKNIFASLETGHWVSLITTLLATIVLVFGWFKNSILTSERDAQNRQSQMVIAYRIKAYQDLSSASNRTLEDLKAHPEYGKNMEDAVADIELFGTPEEIGLVKQFLIEWVRPQPDGRPRASTSPLLIALRNALRQDLELPAVDGPIPWIRPAGGAK